MDENDPIITAPFRTLNQIAQGSGLKPSTVVRRALASVKNNESSRLGIPQKPPSIQITDCNQHTTTTLMTPVEDIFGNIKTKSDELHQSFVEIDLEELMARKMILTDEDLNRLALCNSSESLPPPSPQPSLNEYEEVFEKFLEESYNSDSMRYSPEPEIPIEDLFEMEDMTDVDLDLKN